MSKRHHYVTISPQLFRAFTSFTSILSEVYIIFGEDNISVTQLLPGGTQLIDLVITLDPEHIFEYYTPPEDLPSIIGVYQHDLEKIVRHYGRAGNNVSFSFEEVGRVVLHLGKFTIGIPSIEVMKEAINEKLINSARNWRHEFLCKIDSSGLFELLKYCRKDIDQLRFTGGKDYFNIYGGRDLYLISSTIEVFERRIAENVTPPIVSNYSVEYLYEIFKCFEWLTGVCKIGFSTNKPIKISPELPFEIDLSYYLAPRIET